MANVYVIRHGETECNRDGIVQGPRIDSVLSETGHAQVECLAKAFGATPLDAIFVSPMQRARQTAHALAERQDVPVQVVPELYEMDFGDLCGRPIDEARPIMQELDAIWQQGFTDQPLPGGESPLLVLHRLRAFMRRLAGMNGHVGVVAHGRLNRVLLASLTARGLQRMAEFPQDNAAISHVEPPRIHRLNDTMHLAS